MKDLFPQIENWFGDNIMVLMKVRMGTSLWYFFCNWFWLTTIQNLCLKNVSRALLVGSFVRLHTGQQDISWYYCYSWQVPSYDCQKPKTNLDVTAGTKDFCAHCRLCYLGQAYQSWSFRVWQEMYQVEGVTVFFKFFFCYSSIFGGDFPQVGNLTQGHSCLDRRDCAAMFQTWF